MQEGLREILEEAGRLISSGEIEKAISIMEGAFPIPDIKDSDLHFEAFKVL
ncbi:MAG: hypothetical protein J7M13_06540 [Synergistetes bacterium]|nr:hypothetical protein [Synergistota bacterium]